MKVENGGECELRNAERETRVIESGLMNRESIIRSYNMHIFSEKYFHNLLNRNIHVYRRWGRKLGGEMIYFYNLCFKLTNLWKKGRIFSIPYTNVWELQIKF